MFRSCRAAIYVIISWVGMVTIASGEPPIPEKTPPLLTRFPGLSPGHLLPLDGITLYSCNHNHNVFVAAEGDWRRWSPMSSLPDEFEWNPVGGDRHRLYFLTNRWGNCGDPSIRAVSADGKITVVREEVQLGSQRVVFASKDVGAIYGVAGGLILTTDGGVTWKTTFVPFPKVPSANKPKHPNDSPPLSGFMPPSSPSGPPSSLNDPPPNILGLFWISPSQLLIGNSQSSVGLFEIQRDGAMRLVWVITLPACSRCFERDGEYVWVADYQGTLLHRLNLSDGRIDATVKTPIGIAGMAVRHKTLLTWDSGTPTVMWQYASPLSPPTKKESQHAPREPDSLRIWSRDAKQGYVCREKICIRYLDIAASHLGNNIGGILPLESPSCLIFSYGACFQIDLDKAKITPVALQITPPPPPVSGSLAERSQLAGDLLSLMAQIPRDQMLEFLKPIARETNSSSTEVGKQKIQKARRYLESKGDKKPRMLQLGMAYDDDLPHIENLPNLEYLYLRCSQITDAGLEHLQNAVELQVLDLDSTAVTGEGLVYLKNLTKLRQLDLSGTKVTDATLTNLKVLPQLEILSLDGTKIGDAAMDHIAALTQLRELKLNRTRITDAGLVRLKTLKQLKRLEISSTDITDAGLSHLKALTELRWLAIHGGGARGQKGPDGRIKWEGSDQKYAPNGRWFGIGIMRITDAGIEHLKSLPNLERLDINLTRVTDAGLQTLKGFKQLRWLDLPVMETTPEGIADLKRTLPDCQFTGSWSW